MFVLLTSKWRERAAAVLVALYALCLVAPVSAFAFSDSFVPVPCLSMTDHHHSMGGSHVHQDGIGHHKSSDDQSGPAGAVHSGKCCGLFCVTAIAPPVFGVAEVSLVQASTVALAAAESMLGRSSNRIDRPPRILPSP